MVDIKINVGGRLHSTATGNIIAGADEILDDNKGKKQSEINIDVDTALADRYIKEETYNKEQLNNLITTPDQKYVSVSATSQTTSIADVLPVSGASNTIYRIGSWDGSQYRPTVYSEYTWDGNAYMKLNTKEYGIDDEPTDGSDNLVKSGGVAKSFNILGLIKDCEFDFTTGEVGQYANRNVPFSFIKDHRYCLEVITTDSTNETYFSVKNEAGTLIQGNLCRGKGNRSREFDCSEDGTRLYMSLANTENIRIKYHVLIVDITAVSAYIIGRDYKLQIITQIPSFEWNKGQFIDDNGNVIQSTYWEMSSPIHLNAGDVIVLRASGTGSYAARISTIKDDVYIPKVVTKVSGENTYTYTASYDCDVVLCARSTYFDYVYILPNNSFLAKVMHKIGKITRFYALYRSMLIGGTIYSGKASISNGDCQASTLCCETYFYLGIELKTTLHVKYKTRDDGTKWSVRISFYDENKTYISQYGYSTFDECNVPENAKYFRISINRTRDNEEIKTSILDYNDGDISIDFDLSNDYSKEYLKKEKQVLELNPPSVYENKLKQMKLRFRYGDVIGNPILTLAHFSDIHADGAALSRLLVWTKYFNSYIDDIIHTGDVVNSKFEQGINFWNNTYGSENILQVIGNHDAYPNIAAQDVYNLIFKDKIQNWNVTTAGEGLCYWYKDYATSKIRIIGIDCMHFDNEQKTWITDILSSAKELGYGVVIATHSTPGNITHISCAFNSHHLEGEGILNFASDIIPIVQDFIDNGGEFIFYMGGHTHRDVFGYITQYPEQTVYLIDTARKDNYWTDHISEFNTKSADLFNIIAFDTTSKIVSLLRVGNDCDKYMRHIGFMSWDYANKRVLHSY